MTTQTCPQDFYRAKLAADALAIRARKRADDALTAKELRDELGGKQTQVSFLAAILQTVPKDGTIDVFQIMDIISGLNFTTAQRAISNLIKAGLIKNLGFTKAKSGQVRRALRRIE